jgi:YidC/Oxa1 family membrane protein insertase
MDRNTLIGIGLIGVIFLLWMQLLSPSTKTPTPKKDLRQDSIAAVMQDSIVRTVKKQELSSLGSFSTAAVAANEEIITVETDLFTAKLSTKGATLKSFVQKQYLDFDRNAFDLITAKQGALSLFFQTREGKNITTSDLYFTAKFDTVKFNKKVITLSGSQTAVVPFELMLADGRKLDIIYTFTGNQYKFGFQPNLNGIAEMIPNSELQVVWTGGLAHSEKNKEEESTRSYAHALQADELLKLDADKPNEPFKLNPDGRTKWVSVQTKYFIAALIADTDASGVYLTGSRNTNDAKLVFEDYTVAIRETLPSGQKEVKKSYTVYLGPLDYELMKALQVKLERTLDFGWEWLTRPFAEWLIVPIFNFMNKYITNYGIIIILFAMFIKLVTYPLTMASTNSMKKMATLQPQMQAIQAQYKDDPAKLQSEISKVYKEAGVNPLGGCLPVVLQMPLLYAMFNVFNSSIQLRQESFLWANDLSVPDAVVDFPFSVPLYGDHIAIYPILMAITMYFQQKLTPTQPGPAAEQMKILTYIFPAMFLFFFNNMPAGLGLYYLMFNVFSIAQQLIINKTAKPAPVMVVQTAPVKPKKKEKVA